MNLVRLLLIALISINTTYSLECNLPESLELTCEKTRRVKSMDELNTYLGDYAETEGKARNLLVDFDIDTNEDLNIHSPCKVIFKKFRSLSAKSLCVNGKEGVVFQNNFTLNTQETSLSSTKKIAIRHHANITATNLSLISTGEGVSSRVHIRHDSIINVQNLTLKADARATLGHTSIYTIQNKLEMKSNIEFSSIWKNSTVNAAIVSIESKNKNIFSKNTVINTPSLNLSAPECTVKNVTTTEATGGNCFDTTRPAAKLTRSAKEINSGESVNFSAKKSSDDKGIIKYSFYVNSELVRSNQNPEFSKRFVESGVFYVKVVIEDADGYKASAKRKVVVNESLATSESSYFDYSIEDNNLNLVFHQLIPYEEIASAKYVITEMYGEEGVYEFPITNFYHRSEKSIDDFTDGEYKVGLIVTDIYNRVFLYERVVDYTGEGEFYKEPPIIEYEISQVAPREIMVDFRKIFDPSDRLEWIEVEWGDGEVEELEIDSAILIKHKYSSAKDYEVKVIVAKEVDDDETVSESIRVVSVTNDEVASLPPIIDYNIIIEEFAPYVTFNLSRSISPNAEITSVVFDHGDGTFYTGMDVAHTHFYSPGAYIAKLTITDSNGLSLTQSLQVIITESGTPLIAELDCSTDSTSLEIECEVVGIDKFSELSEMSINWGDGNIENIELYQDDFTWEDISHVYNNKEGYSVALTVKNNRSEEKIAEYLVRFDDNQDGNQPPIASINCYATGNGKEVRCDFSASNDPDGYITNFKIKMGDGNEYSVSNSSPIIHQYQSAGVYNVQIEVSDDKGFVTNSSTSIELINLAPVADIICTSNSFRQISCDSHSYDPDGYIISTEFSWSEGSQVGTETSMSTALESGGFLLVTLRVMDNEGEISEAGAYVEVMDNAAPLALFSCISPSPRVINCDASNSYDPEGSVISFKWSIENRQIGEDSPILNVELSFDGIQEVSLTVTDSEGVTTTKIEQVEILPLPNELLAQVTCNQTDELLLDCDGTQSLSRGYEIESFEWVFSDGDIVLENQFQKTFLQAGDYTVTLNIKAKTGETSSASQSLKIVEVYDLNLPSAGELSIAGEGIDHFYALDETVEVEVLGADIEFIENENGELEPLDFNVTVNDDALNTEKVVFLNNRISLNDFLSDGVNQIFISFRDTTMRIVSKELIIIAGSKDLSLNITSENDLPVTDGEVIVEFLELRSRKFKFDLAEKDTISNFPSLSFLAISESHSNDTWRRGSAVFRSDVIDSINIKTSKFDDQINNENLDFSEGLLGWNLNKGTADTIAHVNEVDNIFEYSAEENKINLQVLPNENGELLITKTINVDDSEGESINFNFRFNPSSGEDYFILSLRNKKTGKGKVLFQTAKELGISSAHWINESIFVDGEDNKIEFQYYSYKRDADLTRTVYNSSFFDLFQLAIANNSNFYDIFSGVSFTDLFVGEVQLKNSFTGDDLWAISLGQFGSSFTNDYVNIYNPSEGVTANKIKVIFKEQSIIDKIVLNPSLRVFLRVTGEYRYGTVHSCALIHRDEFSKVNIKDEGVNLYIDSGSISPSGHKVSLSIVVTESSDCNEYTPNISKVKNKKESYQFDVLLDYGVNFTKNTDNFYSRTDEEQGGDKHVRKTHLGVLRSLLGFHYDFESGSKPILLNDIAHMNGGTFDDRVSSYKGHSRAIGADLRFAKTTSHGEIVKYNTKELKKEETADIVINMLNSSAVGVGIDGITYDNLSHFTHHVVLTSGAPSLYRKTKLLYKLRSSCLANGTRALGYLVDKSRHSNHMHWNFLDTDAEGRFSSPKGFGRSQVPSFSEDQIDIRSLSRTSSYHEVEFRLRDDPSAKIEVYYSDLDRDWEHASTTTSSNNIIKLPILNGDRKSYSLTLYVKTSVDSRVACSSVSIDIDVGKDTLCHDYGGGWGSNRFGGYVNIDAIINGPKFSMADSSACSDFSFDGDESFMAIDSVLNSKIVANGSGIVMDATILGDVTIGHGSALHSYEGSLIQKAAEVNIGEDLGVINIQNSTINGKASFFKIPNNAITNSTINGNVVNSTIRDVTIPEGVSKNLNYCNSSNIGEDPFSETFNNEGELVSTSYNTCYYPCMYDDSECTVLNQ